MNAITPKAKLNNINLSYGGSVRDIHSNNNKENLFYG